MDHIQYEIVSGALASQRSYEKLVKMSFEACKIHNLYLFILSEHSQQGDEGF